MKYELDIDILIKKIKMDIKNPLLKERAARTLYELNQVMNEQCSVCGGFSHGLGMKPKQCPSFRLIKERLKLNGKFDKELEQQLEEELEEVLEELEEDRSENQFEQSGNAREQNFQQIQKQTKKIKKQDDPFKSSTSKNKINQTIQQSERPITKIFSANIEEEILQPDRDQVEFQQFKDQEQPIKQQGQIQNENKINQQQLLQVEHNHQVFQKYLTLSRNDESNLQFYKSTKNTNYQFYDSVDERPQNYKEIRIQSENKQKSFDYKNIHHFKFDDKINFNDQEWEIICCTKKIKIGIYLGQSPNIYQSLMSYFEFELIGLTSVKYTNFTAYIIELNTEIEIFATQYMKYLVGVHESNIISTQENGEITKSISGICINGSLSQIRYLAYLLNGTTFSFHYNDQFIEQKRLYIEEQAKQKDFIYLIGVKHDQNEWMLIVGFNKHIKTINSNIFNPGYGLIPIIKTYQSYNPVSAARLLENSGYSLVNTKMSQLLKDYQYQPMQEIIMENIAYRISIYDEKKS